MVSLSTSGSPTTKQSQMHFKSAFNFAAIKTTATSGTILISFFRYRRVVTNTKSAVTVTMDACNCNTSVSIEN